MLTIEKMYRRIKTNTEYTYNVYYTGNGFEMAPADGPRDQQFIKAQYEHVGTYNAKVKFLELVDDCEMVRCAA